MIDTKEWEANEFAAYLLMPTIEFVEFCEKQAKENGGTVDLEH